ncbi:MAG: hypothetical protein OQJ89_09290 [Kangiellaceae bacterium]|nr:hypothetical protein [Kangiellaceae bacterium]MCW9017146.1 hypothetical protein [Kangiellaceae bacterium]
MSRITQQLEKAVDQCLANEIPADLITALATQISVDDIGPMISYLKDVSDPYDFFRKRKSAVKNSPDGFFLFVDMVSALIISIGTEAEDFVQKQITPSSHFLDWALKYATEDRFSGDIRKRFLNGDPTSEKLCETVGTTQAVEFEAIAEPLTIFESEQTWELSGETDVKAKLDYENSSIRITVSNGYGPMKNLKVYIQLTPLDKPQLTITDKNDSNWLELNVIEEIIYRDGQHLPIAAYSHVGAFEEVVWWKSFETELSKSAAPKRVQMMVIDPKEFCENGEEQDAYTSVVINDWIIERSS